MLSKAVPARLIQQIVVCGVVFAIPVIAFAQYRPPLEVERPVEAAPITDLFEAVVTEACNEQHWPYYSNDCLRGKPAATEPRRISIIASSVQPKSSVKSPPVVKKRRSR